MWCVLWTLAVYPHEKTQGWKIVSVGKPVFFLTEEAVFLGCCILLDNCFPVSRWKRNMPEDEGCALCRNGGGKLPNRMAQQPRRSASSTVTRWKAQSVVFWLWRMHSFFIAIFFSLICLYSFYSLLTLLWKIDVCNFDESDLGLIKDAIFRKKCSGRTFKEIKWRRDDPVQLYQAWGIYRRRQESGILF